MINQFSHPEFAPAANQWRWVRDRCAAVRGRNGWVHFIRVDSFVDQMVDAPYDHDSAGVWQRCTRSIWCCVDIPASFPLSLLHLPG
jgi:uncharacterized protein YfaA (DUF2138 family)